MLIKRMRHRGAPSVSIEKINVFSFLSSSLPGMVPYFCTAWFYGVFRWSSRTIDLINHPQRYIIYPVIFKKVSHGGNGKSVTG